MSGDVSKQNFGCIRFFNIFADKKERPLTLAKSIKCAILNCRECYEYSRTVCHEINI